MGNKSNHQNQCSFFSQDFVNDLVSELISEEAALDAFEQIDDSATVNNASFYGANYFTPADHGTSHVAVVDANGLVVSATTTHNLQFGAKFMSPSTGIIVNNEMDDFSYPGLTSVWGVPPSENNFPLPGKRPVSSMAPAILIDGDGQLRMAVGSAGGTRITTSIVYVSLFTVAIVSN